MAHQSTIETHPQRQKIIDAIVAEQPYRDIIAWTQPPISAGAIARFKRSAQEILRSSTRAIAEQCGAQYGLTGAPGGADPEQTRSVTVITEQPERQAERSTYNDGSVTRVGLQSSREALQLASSPLRSRTEALWQRIDRQLDRAEDAVRVTVDKDSAELVVVGQDLACLAPLLAQAHKNLELLGRATGELDNNQAAPSTQTTINILNLPR